MIKSGTEPYVSSRIGPIKSINEKFETRCGQFACPSTWVKRVTQHLRLEGENPPFPGTMNHCAVNERKNVCERTRTAALIKVKVRTAGALYFIFITNLRTRELTLSGNDRNQTPLAV
jgi:hypothetical protein